MLGEDALEIDHERLLSGLGDRIDGAFGPVALASDVVDLDQSVPEKPVDRVVERARPKLHQPILTSLERDLHHLVRVQRLFGEQPEHQHRQRSQHMLTPTATGTHDAHLSTHTKYSTWNIHLECSVPMS